MEIQPNKKVNTENKASEKKSYVSRKDIKYWELSVESRRKKIQTEQRLIL